MLQGGYTENITPYRHNRIISMLETMQLCVFNALIKTISIKYSFISSCIMYEEKSSLMFN